MILNVYKPAGMTSHDVVDEVRKIINQHKSAKIRIDQRIKVGHAGTLDPFAEGVLIVGIGRESTKELGKIAKDTQKEYIATIELGKVSSTGDPEGEIKPYGKLKIENLKLKINFLNNVLRNFIGEITQTPPRYSAIKIKGKPAYKYAREGKEVELPKRRVKIYEIELVEYKYPFLATRVVCSSGTYIRTLAEDIGKALGTGAYLTKLIRTRVGDYGIEDSVKLEEIAVK